MLKVFKAYHDAPLYQTLARIAAIWIALNVGYYKLLPFVGVSLSYNTSPIAISLYYLFWFTLTVYLFFNLFEHWIIVDKRIWHYGVESMFFGLCVWALLYLLGTFPTVIHAVLPAYTDILFSTPMYFLPKAFEILVQQTLITILVLALWSRFRSLKTVILWYAITFGGAHVLLYTHNGADAPYAAIMAGSAILSAALFPYFILRLKSGFVYSYMVQFLFYITLALIFHTWPPPPFHF